MFTILIGLDMYNKKEEKIHCIKNIFKTTDGKIVLRFGCFFSFYRQRI